MSEDLETRPRGWNPERDEAEDLTALSEELRPLESVRIDAGTWTLGGVGFHGVLEWFSPEGKPQPELLRAIAVACRIAPGLVRQRIAANNCPQCGRDWTMYRSCTKCGDTEE